MRGARHVALGAAIRVGARNEPARLSGITHFLEHMMFRGTARHPTGYAQNHAFESLGGTLEAATDAEATTFTTTVPSSSVAEALSLLGDMLISPRMNGLEIEREVIREELLDALDDDGNHVDPDDVAASALFGTHPLGRPVAGTLETLANIGERDLRSWHRRHYVGQNVIVALAGNVDGPMRRAAIRAFRNMPEGTPSRARPWRSLRARTRSKIVRASGTQVDLRVCFLAPGLTDSRFADLEILARLLDDGLSARVFRTLVEERGLAYDAFALLEAYRDVSILTLGAACRAERANETVSALLELASSTRIPPTQDELARIRARALFDLDLAAESPEAMLDMVLERALVDAPLDLANVARRTRQTTPETLARTAKGIVSRTALSVVAVGPLRPSVQRAIEKTVRRWS